MGHSNETPAAQAGMTTAEARAAVRARREALARAERRHRECWDETERISNLRERLCDLKREDRARQIASLQLDAEGWDETERISNLRERLCDLKREDRARQIASLQLDAEGAKPGCEVSAVCDRMAEEETSLKPPCTEPHAEQCRCPRSTTCRELRRRIAYLKSAVTQTDLQAAFFDVTQTDLQAAFFDLYSAELEMDKARAELFCLLRDLPERIVQEIGEQVPTQEDFDELPNAWGIAAVENHMHKEGSDEPDPVDQLNYRRWLVELSQGALGYSGHLEHEMARHRIELEVLEQQAATVDFFEGDELEQIAQAAVLQKARIAACQEQLDELRCCKKRASPHAKSSSMSSPPPPARSTSAWRHARRSCSAFLAGRSRVGGPSRTSR